MGVMQTSSRKPHVALSYPRSGALGSRPLIDSWAAGKLTREEDGFPHSVIRQCEEVVSVPEDDGLKHEREGYQDT